MNEVNINTENKGNEYTAKDFASDQYIRWCPGCGDFSILAQVQRILPQTGVKRENVVFIAGIGCSSRFPYYMSTYGFHTIHGRALAIASGVKCANPELNVWVSTGDGDCLSIGGNHFIHTLRRNIDINIILFNNRIYGLTKGQYSPTSVHGAVTKSSPSGTIEYPVNPISLALGSGGTFISRTLDRDQKHAQETILRATQHIGTSFIEVFQNCVIFNDGAFIQYTEKDTKEDSVIFLENKKPLVFGKNKDKGIRLEDGWHPKVIDLNDGKHSVNDLLVHDESSRELAFILSEFSDYPELPMPVGVFLDIQRKTYESDMEEQILKAIDGKKINVDELLIGNSTWEI